nr:hypothetical protein CJLB15_00083 [Campylobacter phage CJLB-15]
MPLRYLNIPFLNGQLHLSFSWTSWDTEPRKALLSSKLPLNQLFC